MKKIIAVALFIVVVCFMLVGCNQSLGFGNFNWKHVHFHDTLESRCATVVSWHDNATGIELDTKEYGPIFLSEGSYIMFETGADCPFCGE